MNINDAINAYVDERVSYKIAQLVDTLTHHWDDAIRREIDERVAQQFAGIIAQNHDIDQIIQRVVESNRFEEQVKAQVAACGFDLDMLADEVSATVTFESAVQDAVAEAVSERRDAQIDRQLGNAISEDNSDFSNAVFRTLRRLIANGNLKLSTE
jgi:hypothetical protein